MQTEPTPVKAGYSFNIETTGNVHTVTYKKAKYGAGILLPVFFPAAFLGFLFTRMIYGGIFGWAFFTALVCAVVFFAINAHRKEESFTVSDTAIAVRGKQYDKTHISRFFIKSPGGSVQTMEMTHTGGGFMIGGDRATRIGMGTASAVTTAAGLATQGIVVVGQSFKNSVQGHRGKISYKIGFIYGEKEVMLANKLTENTAEVLLDRVIELSSASV